jgi:hypothetical protein
MKSALIASFSLLIPSLAFGQVLQSGGVTRGHVATWAGSGVIQDAGTATNGVVTNLGLLGTGTPFCINDAAITSSSGYHQLCLGANVSGAGALLSYEAYGGASDLPLQFSINGDTYSIPTTYVQTLGGLSGVISASQAESVLGGTTSGTLYPGNNPSGFITSSGAPVQSVAGNTGVVTVGELYSALEGTTSGTLYPGSNPSNFITSSTAASTYAPLASPALTGVPTSPTATALTSTTQIATTAFTTGAVATETSRAEAAEALKSNIASPTFTGTVTVPTGAVLNTPASVNLTNATALPYSALPALSANNVLGSVTATTPSGLAVPSCSASNDALSWTSGTGFGCNTISTSGTPGGSNTDVQYNSSSSFGGVAGFTFNGTNLATLGVSGTSTGEVQLNGSTSGSITLTPPSGALGTATVTLPDGGTLAVLASPAFTGTPTAPTAAAATNTTQLATTANVVATIEAPPTAGYGSTTPEPVAGTTINASGAITPSTTNGIVGTTLADSANSGSVGEVITATSGTVSLSNSTNTNLESVTLSAGDWNVTGTANLSCSGGSAIGLVLAGFSTTSAGSPAFPNYFEDAFTANPVTTYTAGLPMVRYNVSSTTTVYLVGYVACTGTNTGQGYIFARRVR